MYVDCLVKNPASRPSLSHCCISLGVVIKETVSGNLSCRSVSLLLLFSSKMSLNMQGFLRLSLGNSFP